MTLYSVLFRVVYSFSFVFNLFEIVYIFATRKQISWHRNPQLFVLNLAIPDFSVGCGGIGLSIFSDLDIAKTDDDNIVFQLLLTYGQLSSLACIALLNLDRAIAVIYPFRYKCWRSKRSVISALFISWISSVILQLIYFFTRCVPGKYCFRIIISIAILAVIFFMVAANLNIFNIFRKRSKTFTNTGTISSVTRKLLERRVLYIAFMSTNCVVFFTMPYAILTLLRCLRVNVSRLTLLWAYIIFLLKSVINPIIFFAGRYFIQAHRKSVERSST